jgi:hypothetical protein
MRRSARLLSTVRDAASPSAVITGPLKVSLGSVMPYAVSHWPYDVRRYPLSVPNRASLHSRGARPSTPSQRDKLVAAAVALADREGLAAVSIRRVAAELAVRPMSIYTFIRSKDELLDLMAEAVVSEVLVKHTLPNDWRAAVETMAIQSHDVFIAHPWLAAVSQQRPDLGANALHHAEQLLAAIAPLGLPRRPGKSCS